VAGIRSEKYFSGLSFSPDGKLLATTTESGSGYLWKLETREHYAKLDGAGGDLIEFSPDSQTVATAAGGMIGGPSQVWRADNGARVATIGDNTPGASIAYSHDGKLIATGGAGVSLWDPTTGQRKRQLNGTGYFVSFGPDDKLLAVGNGYSGSAIYEVATGAPTVQLDDDVNVVAFSPDGQTLAVTGTGKEPAIRLLDAKTGKTITRITDGCASCQHVAFTPDGRYVVAYDGELRLWSVSSHRTVAVLTGVGSVIYGLAVSPDGTMIGASDGIQLHIWHGHW
jgi:WD40 repeat protein